VQEVVVVEEILQHVRMHDQGGVGVRGRRVAQVQQFLAELPEQGGLVAGLAQHHAHLALGHHGLGEGAEVEADHGPLHPAPGVGDRVHQSRKLSNCSGSSKSLPRSSAITACRSSRFLPVTRSLSPLTWVSTLSLEPLISAWIFLARSRSMPCLTVIFCRAPATLVSTSPNSRQRVSIFRAARRARRMSVICCSWNSLGARWVITASSRSKAASTPLKSKRV